MNSLLAQQVEEWANVGGTDEMKELADKYTASLAKATNTSVYRYLTSVKGYSKKAIKLMQLGYCEYNKTLVIPVTTGENSSNLHGFIHRSVRLTASGYVASHSHASTSTNDFLPGDPGYDSQQNQDLIVVSDPLDLYRLRSGVDIKTDGVSTKFSAAIPGSQISAKQRERLRGINPRRIVFIRGEDETARELEGAIRKFCLNEVIRLAVVTLNSKDVSEYLKSNNEESLKVKIEKAIRSGGLLDRTARTSDELLSWLATQRPALQTGYPQFDKKARIPVGAMTIIAGRPKHGKTTFLYNLLMQMVDSDLHADKKFYFFSYEESGNRIKQKMLSRILQANGVLATKHDLKDVRTGEDLNLKDVRTGEDLIQRYALTRQEKPDYSIAEIEAAKEKLDTLLTRIEVVNDSLTVEELDKMIRKLNDREAIGAIFIDYMQRIRTDKERGSIRENMNHVSDVLRWCAVNTGLSLIVGAQISRKADEKNRPAQSDIKESGNLEEDANLVLCVYNETQASLDQGNKNNETQAQHDIQVYTLNSRDSEPFETKFVMTNRYFKEVKEV
jgi:replicative DNA helicase